MSRGCSAEAVLLLVAFLALGILVSSRVEQFTSYEWRPELVAGCELHYYVP